MDSFHDGIFPENKDVVLTNYGRTAFEKILQIEDLSGATVAFPALLWNDLFEHLIEKYEIEPVFVDVDPQYYHMNVERVNRMVQDLDAVFLNHTFGVPVDMHEWRAIADKRDVVLIEDCVRGLGAVVDGRPIGWFGDYAIYSLKKVTPAVRGGALAGNVDPTPIDLEPPVYDVKNAYPLLPSALESRIIELIRNKIKNYGPGGGDEDGDRSSTPDEYYPLIPELRKLDGINRLVFFYHLFCGFEQRRKKNIQLQRRIRCSLTEFDVTFQKTRGTCPFHFIGLTVPTGRDELADRMRDSGLAPRTLWNPPLVSSFVEDSRLDEYPNTMAIAENGLQLPLVEMDEDDVGKAIEAIQRTIGKAR